MTLGLCNETFCIVVLFSAQSCCGFHMLEHAAAKRLCAGQRDALKAEE